MKKPTILILHGWGASTHSFQEVKALLEKKGFAVDVPDLPGFGTTPLVKDPMTFDDYLAFVKAHIANEKVILLGHSFGGRLAIAFAAANNNQISKLILTGASGITHPLSARKKIAFLLAKVFGFAKPFRKYLYYAIGELDYYKSGRLRETFRNIYRVNIAGDLARVRVPTLIVWGEKDTTVPLSDGDYIHDQIKNSQLVVVAGATHDLPYAMPHVFVEKILPFLTKKLQ